MLPTEDSNTDKVLFGQSATFSRRALLKGSLQSMAALSIPVTFVACSDQNLSLSNFAWLLLNEENQLILNLPKIEMGQDIKTSLALIVASQLSCSPNSIEIIHPKYSTDLDPMATAGSTSISQMFEPLQKAAAQMREQLINATAIVTKSKLSNISIQDEFLIIHGQHEKIPRNKLIAIATSIPLNDSPHIIKHNDFSNSFKADIDLIIKGGLTYSSCTKIPGMRYASALHSPFLGGKIGSIDSSSIPSFLGSVEIKVVGNVLFAIGETTWHADQAIKHLKVNWLAPKNISQLSDQVTKKTYQELIKIPGELIKGEIPQIDKATKAFDFEIMPQAHAPLEPITCTIEFKKDGCHIWVGTQNPAGVKSTAENLLRSKFTKLWHKLTSQFGFDDDIHIHTMPIGGSFGRRLESDFVEQALQLALTVEGPVQVFWSREQDIKNDFYRPYTMHRVILNIEQERNIDWHHRIVGPSRGRCIGGAEYLPYQFNSHSLDFHKKTTPIPIGSWRGIGPAHNVFIIESMVDELANKFNQDPFDFRFQHLKSERLIKVLRHLQSLINDAHSAPDRTGIAVYKAYGSYCAQAVILRSNESSWRIEKIFCVADVGKVINSSAVQGQLEGGIIFGLNAAIGHEINLNEGKIKQSNFHNYALINIAQAPKLSISMIESSEAPSGVGELGVPGVAPALANAIKNTTGARMLRLPFNQSDSL